MKMSCWVITGGLAALIAMAACAEDKTGLTPPPQPASEEARTQKNYDKPGFVTILDKDGRLWVFRVDSKELAEFREKGEPAKVVVRPRKGPDGLTLKSTDNETIEAYLAAP